ncbi:CheR family methyltransferase [Phenylobacterium sp.]|uniref:CheR family methyltransferase n=1 Tax=Phenylobacterium sp. TaxID=1871053 RepID=UPI0025E54F91|nr:CheR family methyltransferase [Phenylobacterium sp.]
MSAQVRHAEAEAPIGTDQLSNSNFKRLAELIQNYSGIKMPQSKRTMLEGRLRRRMRATGIATLNDYCRYLFDENGLDTEIVHLIDAVTTNKTEFFREPAHFKFLEDKALPAIARQGRRQIKSWSAACSIGAEPYTLAMVFEEFRKKSRGPDYSILCTDLSTQVLSLALAGVFSEAMIAPVPMDLRRRYLMRSRDARRDQVRIVPQLRSRLSFARLNLMDEAYPVERDMDMVFCRNILIYFDKPTQSAVLRRLCDHLRPGGYLFLGHSESIVGLDLPVTQIANTVFQRS